MNEELKKITELLCGNNPEQIREGAYLAMHNGSHELVPALVKQIEFPNPGVQEAVELALRKIGGQVVLFPVLPLLRSEDQAVRNIAMDLLREVAASDVMAVVELLRDEDPDLRIFGADILGATGSVMAVEPLGHSLLRDPETNVRYQAAVSLGALGFSEAAASLERAMKDEEWVQFAVIEALTKIGGESSVSVLLAALDKSTELVASSIVHALGKLRYIKAVPLLIQALPTASVPLADKIVCAIVNIVGPKSLTLLGAKEYERLRAHFFTALKDEDEEVQDAAISGLASGKGDEEFAAIFEILAGLNPNKDHDRMVKLANVLSGMGYHAKLAEFLESRDEVRSFLAIDIMSNIDDPVIMPLLKEAFWRAERDLQRAIIVVAAEKAGAEDQGFFADVLARHKDGTALKSALYYFGKLGDARLIIEQVMPLLDHPYNDVREAALDASVAPHSAEVNAFYQDMSKDADENRRIMSYYAMGHYALTGNLPLIISGLDDESPKVRQAAVEAMQGKGTQEDNQKALKLLGALLDDENMEVRLAVMGSLGTCPEPEAVDLLLRGFKDESPWVRARCVENLGRKKLEEVVPDLARLLDDSVTLVAVKAIEALAYIGGETAFQYLLPLVNHPDHEVQSAAENAVHKIREGSGGN